MAGRGRGRGRGTPMAAIADTLGLGRGELAGLAGLMQPPPLYPPREFNALPMEPDKERSACATFAQHFRLACRKQPYYIRKPAEKKGVDRYTDRYREVSHVTDNTIGWTPNWSKMPAELRIKVRSRRPGGAQVSKSMRPNLAANRKRTGNVDVKKTLEMLEAKEKEDDNTEDKEDEDDDAVDDDYYNEEDMEENTDYNATYFDPGEDYGFEDEDAMDEPEF
ncbi:DNA-directed RNA polymerase III subunit RPC7-like [Sycon ciliatum]|uniref:DNA-directed RNA polymerase III subunit RPC7-like n=1 Tax=Sycon ciliatum TaxID=27933 RepID=UPI0020A95410|eukprot:scpid87383/ scgid24360/ DNA-directed RNA polymerase III subunit RPC7-like; DNA-directed RNA polymerase III subunit G-like